MTWAEEPLRRELDRVLPVDVPRRAHVLDGCVRHLELTLRANQELNLTRITEPREAAIKHSLDALLPWPQLSGAAEQEKGRIRRAMGASP